jgi:two-component system phosphate regulon sensor histidine kinase PhoR
MHSNFMDHSNIVLIELPIAIVTTNEHFEITLFNPKAEELTGYAAKEAVGQKCSEILGTELCGKDCPIHKILHDEISTIRKETTLTTRYSDKLPVIIHSRAIHNVKGEFKGCLEAFEDISREKAQEREKNNFQFMLAHDMKSPLVAILGLIGKIREHHDDMSAEKLEQYCKTIKESGEQLEAQVLEFLEYSRQLTDKIKLNLEAVDLTELIDQLVQRYQQQAAKKEIAIRTDYEPLQEVKVDSHQIQRVFENLLNNAIKFTQQHGEIYITIKSTAREVIIQVKDNGPGIKAEELPYIFDAFHQSKSSSSGHGLGLTAVKAIVQEHGGRVAVTSSLEKGTVFTVRLPRLH